MLTNREISQICADIDGHPENAIQIDRFVEFFGEVCAAREDVRSSFEHGVMHLRATIDAEKVKGNVDG